MLKNKEMVVKKIEEMAKKEIVAKETEKSKEQKKKK